MKCGDFMNKKQVNIGLVLLGGMLVLNVFNSFTIKDMKYSIDNLRSQIDGVNTTLDDSINDISYSVSEALKKEASLINDFKYEYGVMKDGKIDLSFTVSPKEISHESKYFFSYSVNGEEKVIDGVIDGTSKVIATTNVPVNNSSEINFIVKSGDKREIESLEHLSSFESTLIEPFDFEGSDSGMSFSYSDNKLSFGSISFKVNFDNSYMNEYADKENERQNSLSGVRLYVAVDEKIKDSFDMTRPDDDFPPFIDTYEYEFDQYSLTLKPKEKLEIYALADHEDGYKVRIVLDTISIDESGRYTYDLDTSRGEKSVVY